MRLSSGCKRIVYVGITKPGKANLILEGLAASSIISIAIATRAAENFIMRQSNLTDVVCISEYF